MAQANKLACRRLTERSKATKVTKARETRKTKETTPEPGLQARRIGLVLMGVAVLATLAALAPWAGWLMGEARASAPTARYSAGQATGAKPLMPYDYSGQVVNSPNPGTTNNILKGVAVASANDVWAVGYDTGPSSIQTLVEHWNGSAWSVVSSPNPSSTDNELYGVAVVSANDIWAVGDYSSSFAHFQTLMEHWNGSSWLLVNSPNPSSTDNFLNGVAVVGANDVWAVGNYSDDSGNDLTLVEHWNSSTWSVVPSPNPNSSGNWLHSVAVVSANDIWAVGVYSGQSSGQQLLTLSEHWNGSVWLVVPSLSPGSYENELDDVAVASANDVWAAGSASNGNNGLALTEHWNGSAWSLVSSSNAVDSAAVVSTNDVWAAGSQVQNGAANTSIEHWNGSMWSSMNSPSPGSYENHLFGLAVASANDVWAVGDYSDSGSNYQALIEKWNGTVWSVVPNPGSATATPTRAATPIGATATRTPTPRSGATASPTPCRGFWDVPIGSTFYPFVTCLVSRGIVSGYQDCSFHVNSNVTRGQLSKIVSLAANFTDPPGSQIFQDIAPLSTFYDYVQRLANRSIAGGYACGGLGEPCMPPTNRPYFRPNANATRGQVSKIVVNAFIPNCQVLANDR